MRGRAVVPTILLGATCASCILGPQPNVAKNLQEGEYCASPHALGLETDPASDPPDLPAPEATALGYSPHAIETARAIGATALLERLARAQAAHASEEAVLHFKGQLNDAIVLATLDLSSTIAHVLCEEGRAFQMASNLRDAEQTQTRNLTAWSLLVTSLATIASGTLALADKDPVPSGAAAITGGAGGLALGIGTLLVHRSAPFLHARNILAEVWVGGRDHPDFPELVWAYLTWPDFGIHGSKTVRDYLVAAWAESGRLGDHGQASRQRVELLLGKGGTYDADALEDRGDMLSEVREAIGLMSHELQHLAAEAARH